MSQLLFSDVLNWTIIMKNINYYDVTLRSLVEI